MKLKDLSNLIPHTTIATGDNPISKAIRDKRTNTLKLALRQKKANNPRSDAEPGIADGNNAEDTPMETGQ